MSSAICTLFEGDFHYGLGGLANSLYACGFRGPLWAGYRGALPPWAQPLREEGGHPVFDFATGCSIHFIPVTTERHLTNHKPQFMRQVLDQLAADCTQIFYFDPDIVVRFPWSFFLDWASDAVALCEDVNSPIPDNHPKRNGWRRFFAGEDLQFRNSAHTYVNGGFVGLPREHSRFLTLWESIMETMTRKGVDLGDIGYIADYRFWNMDQDALNVAMMTTDCPMSVTGKDGMGFVATSSPMLHAIGKQKPWHRNVLRSFSAGRPPTLVEREFWQHVERPIELFSASVVKQHRRLQTLASVAARFYRR